MEYFNNIRPSFIYDYYRYLDFTFGSANGTVHAEFVRFNFVPISTIGVNDNRIGYPRRTPNFLPENAVFRNWLHLHSYNAENPLAYQYNVNAFSTESPTISVVASNFVPTTTNNNNSPVVYSNIPRSIDDRTGLIRQSEFNNKLDNSDAFNCNRLNSDSRASGKRKAKRPQKGAIKGDPTFRGVAFHLELQQGKVRLRAYTGRFRRRCRKFIRDDVKSGLLSADSLSEVEIDVIKSNKSMYADSIIGKKCSSCDTRKTPLWRDAEDGTPLCNACGIRYKKYRIRCVSCWFVPRKEGKANAQCHRCGDPLRVVSN